MDRIGDLLTHASRERVRSCAVKCRCELVGDDGAWFVERLCSVKRERERQACSLTFRECAGWRDELFGVGQAADREQVCCLLERRIEEIDDSLC